MSHSCRTLVELIPGAHTDAAYAPTSANPSRKTSPGAGAGAAPPPVLFTEV
jgi:hypothetical protein